MRVSAIKALGILLACGLLSACSQWRYDLGIPLAKDIAIPAQYTPLAEALALLGPPLRMSSTDSGFVLAWEHWDIRENKIGFSLGFAGADAMSIDWGRAKVKGEFLLLGFDHEHRLTDSTFTDWDSYAGGGKALQPFVGLVPVVDVDDLLVRMPQHRWGAASLDALPTTLNTDNRPDMGQNGIEQRGTPTTVGQRSLEHD